MSITPEQLREAADIIEQKIEWEFYMDKWIQPKNQDHNNLVYNVASGWEIRRKPWTLGRSVNGHSLADGQEWQKGGWKQSDLPVLTRPLIMGEREQEGDEWVDSSNKWDKSFWPHLLIGDPGVDALRRTTRPLPQSQPLKWQAEREAFARGEKIEFKRSDSSDPWVWSFSPKWNYDCEYRIHDPCRELKKAFARGEVIQYQQGHEWIDTATPVWYGTVAYRVKPAPKLIPLCADDITTAHEFLSPEGLRHQWYSINTYWVSMGEKMLSFDYLQVQGWKYRAGTEPFKACSKEAQP